MKKSTCMDTYHNAWLHAWAASKTGTTMMIHSAMQAKDSQGLHLARISPWGKQAEVPRGRRCNRLVMIVNHFIGGIIDEPIPPTEFNYSNSDQRELREVTARAIWAAKRATQRAARVAEKLEGWAMSYATDQTFWLKLSTSPISAFNTTFSNYFFRVFALLLQLLFLRLFSIIKYLHV